MISNEQLTAFIKNQPVSVGCGILVVLLGVGIYFRSDAVPEAEKVLDDKSMLGQRIDANIKNGVELPEQLSAVMAARQEIESRLVHQEELAKNLQYFYKLEADTGIKLVDLRQAQPSKTTAKGPKTNYLPVGYAVVVRGDYAHLLDFLRRLESTQRFCRVLSANINLGGSADKDRTGDLTISLNLELLGQQSSS